MGFHEDFWLKTVNPFFLLILLLRFLVYFHGGTFNIGSLHSTLLLTTLLVAISPLSFCQFPCFLRLPASIILFNTLLPPRTKQSVYI